MIQLSEEQEVRARRLHRESFVFDYFPEGEPLLLSASEEAAMQEAMEAGLRGPSALQAVLEQRTRDLEKDPAAAERMRGLWQQAGVNAVACTLMHADTRYDEHEAIVREIARWNRRFQVADYLAHCRSADDLEHAFAGGRVGVLFNLQSPNYIGNDLDNLDVLYSFGVRMIQLTYNTRNLLGDGCLELVQAGLTHFGVDAVRRMNRLGIVVDVAHSGVQTTLDAIEVSERPIAFSHTGCRTLFNHPRNKSDEQLKALADADGYVGIYAVPFMLTGQQHPGLETMLDHIEHAANIVETHRVGIGTDWGVTSPEFPAALRAGMREVILGRSA